MMLVMYPNIRMRRNRKAGWTRDLVSENNLFSHNLILPLFVCGGYNQFSEIESMPGVFRFSSDLIIKQLKIAEDLGIKAAALFPVIDKEMKDNDAKEAYNPGNLICKTISMIKASNINIGIICDVALDPYTIHGHDGIMINKIIENDKTLEILCKQALVLSEAGADSIAPSDMMDGRVKTIREYIDSRNYSNVNIISYAAKYASCFYGPFRTALDSAKAIGKDGKRAYQMDVRNSKEAMREIDLDILEGADSIIIKPGLPFLDIIKEAHKNFDIPIFAYQVSGEYSMLKFASMAGCFDFQEAMIESLICLKRAGSSAILCYNSIETAQLINKIK
jgi:porphobilinogen synthase